MDRSYPRNLDMPRADTAFQYGRTVRGSSRAWVAAVMMKRELDGLPSEELENLEHFTAEKVTNILA